MEVASVRTKDRQRAMRDYEEVSAILCEESACFRLNWCDQG